MELDLEAIKDIANEKCRTDYPLLANHYNNYDVKCITWAVEEWKKISKKIKRKKEKR